MSDEHYPGEADESAAAEASCMEPMTPHALTREQVITEQDLIEMAQAFGYDLRWAGFCLKVKALRQALTQQAQEVETLNELLRRDGLAQGEIDSLASEFQDLKQEIESWKRTANAYEQAHQVCNGQLSAMRAERDEKAKALDAFELTLSETITKLEASQARVRELEGGILKHRPKSECYDRVCQSLGISHNILGHVATLQTTLAEREARTKELEEWQKIVIGSGTDQETVIRMAANEYTKSAVQCWKEHTKKIEAERDTARQDAARLREALELCWTKEIPTKPGLYFYRRDSLVDTCRVAQFDIDENTFRHSKPCEWAGPIPSPIEQAQRTLKGER